MRIMPDRRRHQAPGDLRRKAAGFTLIELMIVIAIIAIILTLALPVYTNYTTRAKLGEAVAVAAAAKTAVAATCHEDLTLTGLDNDAVGYGFTTSEWVQAVNVSGECVAPVITVSTQYTGAPGDPDIVLTGDFQGEAGRISWACTSTAADYHLPKECRGGS